MKILCISLTLPVCPSEGMNVIEKDARIPFLVLYINILLVLEDYMIMTTEQSLY